MTATARAYAFAKERILDGRFAGGDLISEGDVAAGVGLSRTPVREAFLRLESEGLLRLYPKRGALVIPVSAAEVESVMETRLLVERFAIEKVIRLGIDLEAELAAAIAHQESVAASEDSRAFVEADREFHRILVAAAGNPILLGLHDSLRDRQSRMNLAALARDERRTRQILEEHRGLAAAVARRDEGLARTRVDAHLHTTLALLRGAPTLLGADPGLPA
ncbi:GntR family transcriptional regulator [Baekduia soli]|uniref:GntR family transcriptional regulator n=1 Tax=Baekduia soli TaxID=496014 RepID=A0A5B8U379_9ACTN|nr:GntR family transcriptional regulator [Baekduia soli]QEC47391.1 GntR family transcriptional regulator [Baekduia soli]